MFNYWTIDLRELPTRGVYYDPDAEIRIRPLAVSEIKQLATFNPGNAVLICNELLRRCIELEKLEFNDIILEDREYLIFWIRANSYVQSAGYSIKARCPYCKNSFEKQFKIENFNTKQIERKLESIHLPDSNIELPMKMPTIRDLKTDKISSSLDDVTNIALHIDAANDLRTRINFINNLSAKDYSVLKYTFNECSCGIDKGLQCQCPECHNISKAYIDIKDDKLFAPTKTKDILEEITRIAKYCNVQITDDWLWREVEIERIIVNDMIKKENEEHQKEMSKAKAQQNAAMAKARAHGAHF